MIEDKREALSAMLDDELPDRVVDQLVTDLEEDTDLRAAMSRYRLIGDVLRGNGVSAGPEDIAAAVRERLSEEPAILAPQRGKIMASWVRGLAGLAIAASVALVAVGILSQQGATPDLANERPILANNAPPVEVARQAPTQPLVPAPAGVTDSKLARYLAEHNEFASRGGAKGFMSYATFVAYDGR